MQLSAANRLYLHGGKRKPHGAAGDHDRRLVRLQEILDEVVALTLLFGVPDCPGFAVVRYRGASGGEQSLACV